MNVLLGRPDPVSAHWGRLLRRGVPRGMGRPSSGATSRPLTLALLPELPTLLGFPAASQLSGPHVFRSIPGPAGGSGKGRRRSILYRAETGSSGWKPDPPRRKTEDGSSASRRRKGRSDIAPTSSSPRNNVCLPVFDLGKRPVLLFANFTDHV
jgi:hypothetical protein